MACTMIRSAAALASVGFFALAGCGGEKTTPPEPAVLSVTPPSGSLLAASTSVVVTFNQSMTPSSLVVGGPMGMQGDRVWSATARSNDTLTFMAGTVWPDGAVQLIVDVAAASGKPLPTLPPSISATSSPNGALLGAVSYLDFVFSEPVDPGSLTLGGTMAADAGPLDWRTAGLVVRISPTSAWTEGASRTLVLQANDLAGNPLSGGSYGFSVDANPPMLASVSPPTAQVLGNATPIVLTFTEPIDPATVVRTGTQTAAADVSVVGATLTFTPQSGWRCGIGQTLGFTVTDLAGNPLTGVVTYDVGTIWVRGGGSDADPGTRTQPVANVYRAVELAKARGYTETRIFVAGGTYAANSRVAAKAIDLGAEGASIEGGYDPANWGWRDPAAYPTRIVHDAVPSFSAPETWVIRVNAGVETHRLSGLALEANRYTDTCAVLVGAGGNASLSGMTVKGGGGDGGATSAAACIRSGSLWIDGSTLVGAVASPTSVPAGGFTATGLSCDGTGGYGSLQSFNNVIYGHQVSSPLLGHATAVRLHRCYSLFGQCTAKSGDTAVVGSNLVARGLHVTGDATAWNSVENSVIVAGASANPRGVEVAATGLTLRSNTILVGNAVSPIEQYNYGVFLDAALGTTQLVNNIVRCSGSDLKGYGFYEQGPQAPAAIDTNDVYGCQLGLYFDADSGRSFDRICNGTFGSNPTPSDCLYRLTAPTGIGNLSVDPALDADGRPTASTPMSIRTQGTYIGGSYSDRDGMARTIPFSIGAYEVDPP
jgi:hypothetical protein